MRVQVQIMNQQLQQGSGWVKHCWFFLLELHWVVTENIRDSPWELRYPIKYFAHIHPYFFSYCLHCFFSSLQFPLTFMVFFVVVLMYILYLPYWIWLNLSRMIITSWILFLKNDIILYLAMVELNFSVNINYVFIVHWFFCVPSRWFHKLFLFWEPKILLFWVECYIKAERNGYIDSYNELKQEYLTINLSLAWYLINRHKYKNW